MEMPKKEWFLRDCALLSSNMTALSGHIRHSYLGKPELCPFDRWMMDE